VDYVEGVSPGKKRHASCAEVARILRAERERQGLSMNGLAAKAGMSQQMVSYIERELRTPTLDVLFRLTDALGLEAWQVVHKAGN
jgi:transcriptional regulator with XRE-family HTH domain